MAVRIMVGDVREKLAEMADESVHCVVTSPPYWGLRDYQLPPQVWGGDADCEHEWREETRKGISGGTDNPYAEKLKIKGSENYQVVPDSTFAFCRHCNAWRGSLGLEPTPDLYLEHMVAVFREVRRVLRSDGTVWLNMGDSYTSGGRKERDPGQSKLHPAFQGDAFADGLRPDTPDGLKPKDLCMMPARLALALQCDGWWLRSEIVWAKPNPMPESIRDRPTSAHEKMFLLSKAARYFYDSEAVREPVSESTIARWGDEPTRNLPNGAPTFEHVPGGNTCGVDPGGRNLRNVWNIATQPYPEAHFATFPTALVEPCIKAGSSEKGCCPECGAPWVREREKTQTICANSKGSRFDRSKTAARDGGERTQTGERFETKTTGWSPSCGHTVFEGNEQSMAEWEASEDFPHGAMPCTVLDPFAGSGTTGLVADRLGRDAILIELNPEYAAMAEKRLHADAGMFAEVAI